MLNHLFTECKIGSITIPNRLVMSPMITNNTGMDNKPNARVSEYYIERAKGGWGLLIQEAMFVTPKSRAFENTLGMWDDSFIPLYKELLDSVHQYGTKMFAQLHHAGRQADTEMGGEAPTCIPCPVQPTRLPHELTTEEVKELVSAYGKAAKRVKEAGFDGIEIHAGHGYLINAFMDFFANKRTDEYGGCFRNRVRFAEEIINEIRANVGNDYPLGIRISYNEAPGGLRPTDLKTIAHYLANNTKLDFLDLTVGTRGIAPDTMRPMFHDRAWLVDLASEIKKYVDIPVMTVSRIYDPFMADEIIANGKADFVMMARQTLADPDMPNKVKAGKYDCVRHCIGCLQGCEGNLMVNKSIGCMVNPRTGYEYCDDISKVEEPKHVVIIGGGPAGIEAAHAAAIKGHKVDLYEKEATLGGNFLTAAYPPGKGEFVLYTTWAMNELPELGVTIHYNTELSKEEILALNADKIIVAVGGVVAKPPIPGIDGKNVVTAEDILRGKVAAGLNVVVAGGGSVGAETGLYLGVGKGRNVTVVEMRDQIAGDDNAYVRPYLINELNRFQVKQLVNTKILEFKEDCVKVEQNGVMMDIPCDTIVLAFGYRTNTTLADELKAAGADVVLVGDAKRVSNALAATREGYEAGLHI